jgi:hypothetical protein
MQAISSLTLRAGICAALALAGATAAQADGVATSISGFGTVGGSFTSNSNYVFRHEAGEFTGASNQFDIGLDSRIGVQARFDFGSGFSVTAQEVVRERGDKTFDPGTEWLYLQYSPTSDLKLRVGRVVMATFLYSDSREVGFAAPWFRAPTEVYGAEPFNYLDGAQALWNVNLGQFVLKLESSYGTTDGLFQTNGLTLTSHAKDIFNAAIALEYGNILLRVAQTSLNVPTNIPLSQTLVLNYNIQDKFTTIGVQYDDGRAIVVSEFAKRHQNDAPVLNEPLSNTSQWYVAGGWRFGKFTPLLSYAKAQNKKSILSPTEADYGTWSGSLRYDVVNNVALKAEISRAQAGNGSYWITPNPASGERVNVYSLGADFVF